MPWFGHGHSPHISAMQQHAAISAQASLSKFLISGFITQVKSQHYNPGKRPQTVRGAKGYETSGGDADDKDSDDDDDDDDEEDYDDDDDDDDTQMRAHISRHRRAHESRHIREDIWEHMYESRQMRAHIRENTYESTHMRAHI